MNHVSKSGHIWEMLTFGQKMLDKVFPMIFDMEITRFLVVLSDIMDLIYF